MQVKEVMSKKPAYLPPTSSVKEAAKKMKQLDCGFIPVGENDKLIGTVTDRDIVLHAAAQGKDPGNTALRDVMSEGVEYCYENDDLDEATKRMERKQIHRLIVLNDKKRMTGILSLGDIARRSQDDDLCAQAVEGIFEDRKKWTH
ncbi:CBS domain protein [Coxiella burnetii str. Namibia]|nr:CBS domain protein [Coxiella burnetii str. Namibia]